VAPAAVFLAGAGVVFLVAGVVACVVFMVAGVVAGVVALVAGVVVVVANAALVPFSTDSGGNHTSLVALAFARNEARRAAHRSASLFHRLLISIIYCVPPPRVLSRCSPWP
jgi:hypothetical protein